MKKLSLEKLKEQYEFVCNEYVGRFIDKQELDFDGWIGDEVGGIASFCSQYFFSLNDIVLDINSNQPKGLILDWQDDMTDYSVRNNNSKYINYYSYIKGLRLEDIKL